jgi:hypothetical protein
MMKRLTVTVSLTLVLVGFVALKNPPRGRLGTRCAQI